MKNGVAIELQVAAFMPCRHAYAIHQLEAGLPVERLQQLPGHQDLHSTLRPVHWVPSYREGEGELDLIAKLEVSHG